MIQTAAMVLRNGTRLLNQSISGDTVRDARLLMAHVLGTAPDRLTLELSRMMTPQQVAQFEHLIKQRMAHKPVSQLIGKRQFWGHWFRVTPDVLDPRPDTETLVAEALKTPAEQVLDLGTGSGCILLSLLSEWPDAQGLGVDLSEAALAVARENARALGVADRVSLCPSDWFAAVDGTFDLIVSNPPYISAEEMQTLAPDVRDHEPHLALTPTKHRFKMSG